MIREVEDGLGKISLRTEAPYDASAICQRLGGGGHAAAAGASVPGGIEGAKAGNFSRRCGDSGVELVEGDPMANGILVIEQARRMDESGRGGQAARRIS